MLKNRMLYNLKEWGVYWNCTTIQEYYKVKMLV